VVKYSHLGVVRLHGDQLSKQLLQDQQWNLSFVALERAGNEVKWLKNFLANIPLGTKLTSYVSILMIFNRQ